jgi:glycosyltransferase involved in cell wall biosynthesis
MEPDEIVVLNTGATPQEEGFTETDAVARAHGAKVYYKPFNDDFSEVRNYAFDRCTHETVMWLDSDDEVANPVEFAKAIRTMARSDINCLASDYLYEFDGTPNQSPCTTRLVRERVVKKSQFQWKSPIHEVLACKHQFSQQRLRLSQGYVFQHFTKGSDPDGLKAKLDRNLRVLEKHWPDGQCETRMLFYWGNTLLGLGRYEDASEKYHAYMLRKDAAPGERHVVICSVSELMRKRSLPDKALIAANMAVTENATLPSGWLHKSEAHLLLGQIQKALDAAAICESCFQYAGHEVVRNEAALKSRPHFIRAYAALHHSKDVDAAVGWCSKALDASPNEAVNLALRDDIQSELNVKRTLENFSEVCKSLPPEDAERVADKAPQTIRHLPQMQQFWRVPEVPLSMKVAIVCGRTGLKDFDDSSLVKGISGSEEATIHVSRELEKRGFAVDIFNERPAVTSVDDTAIRYIPYACWSADREYDLIIYWRTPTFPYAFPSSSTCPKLLWLHDVINPETMQGGWWESFDHVLCLSNFHRDICGLENVSNVLMTRNGIDVESMPEMPDKDMDMVIWPSDPGRGLLTLFEMWDELKAVRPNLHLEILYGFSERYEEHMRIALESDTRDAVLKMAERDDITFHGMVPQAQCHEMMAKAGWWLYPTAFPEISCITAMKAQALGCRSVVTDGSAVKETMQYGIKVPPGEGFSDRFRDTVVEQMKDPSSMEEMVQEGIEWAQSLGWGPVVDQWLEATGVLAPSST